MKITYNKGVQMQTVIISALLIGLLLLAIFSGLDWVKQFIDSRGDKDGL